MRTAALRTVKFARQQSFFERLFQAFAFAGDHPFDDHGGSGGMG